MNIHHIRNFCGALPCVVAVSMVARKNILAVADRLANHPNAGKFVMRIQRLRHDNLATCRGHICTRMGFCGKLHIRHCVAVGIVVGTAVGMVVGIAVGMMMEVPQMCVVQKSRNKTSHHNRDGNMTYSITILSIHS
ncbi:MAG: hypothetical protein R3Y65_08065 [Bacillota bacterium]